MGKKLHWNWAYEDSEFLSEYNAQWEVPRSTKQSPHKGRENINKLQRKSQRWNDQKCSHRSLSQSVRKNLVRWGGQMVEMRRNALKLYLCLLSLLSFSAWWSILGPGTHTHIVDSSSRWCHLLIFGKDIMSALRLSFYGFTFITIFMVDFISKL